MFDVCRLCLSDIPEIVNKLSYDDYTCYDTKIKLIMPEIDINTTTTFILCDHCSESLNKAYNFKCRCLEVEELINNYLKEMNLTVTNLKYVKDRSYKINESTTEPLLEIKEESYEYGVSSIYNSLEDGNLISDQSSDAAHVDIIEMNHFKEKIDVFETESIKNQSTDRSYKFNESTTEPSLEIKEGSYDNGVSSINNSLEDVNLISDQSSDAVHNEIIETNHFKEKIDVFETEAIKNQSTGETYMCDICNKIFLNCRTLQQHKSVHGDRRFRCKICKKSYKSNYDLKQHAETRKADPNTSYQCNIRLKSVHNLKRHILTMYVKRYICEVCGLKCATNAHLIEHMRTHTGDRPFRCEMCGKGFAQRSTLANHIKSIHTREKPYVCETCGMAFISSAFLKKHGLVHVPNRERTFVCDVAGCNKSFRDKQGKREHMKRHNPDKKYKCTVCEKAFLTGPHLKRHIICHTGEKPFDCTICGKTFNQKGNLKIHLKSHRPRTS